MGIRPMQNLLKFSLRDQAHSGLSAEKKASYSSSSIVKRLVDWQGAPVVESYVAVSVLWTCEQQETLSVLRWLDLSWVCAALVRAVNSSCWLVKASRRQLLNESWCVFWSNTLSPLVHSSTVFVHLFSVNNSNDGEDDDDDYRREIRKIIHVQLKIVEWMFCSVLLAVLDPTVGHTIDVLSPFISVFCHSD